MNDRPPSALPFPLVPGLSDLSVFARGGYATVYRAVQESVGREVAVKVENRALDNERDQRRFMREARAAGRMSSHPHVVDLFDVGVTPDLHPYLIMEMCDGSYADRMKTSPLDAFEARDVGVKIADALADAHHLGVLHRDVKPANILYSRFNEPALADFGLAVLVEARDASVTLEVLTPAYAPLESFQHRPPSPAADVYALCATLYAIMHGKPARWDDERSPSLMMLLELFDRPVPDLPGVHPALTRVLRQGMANDPGQRPSAVALRDMLAAVPLGSHWSPAAPHRPPFSIAPASGGQPTGQPTWRPIAGGQPTGSPPVPPQARPATPSHESGGASTGNHNTWSVPVPPVEAVGSQSRGTPAPHPPPPGVTGTGLAAHPRLRMLLSGIGVLTLLVMTSLGTWFVAKGSAPGWLSSSAASTGSVRPGPTGASAAGSTGSTGPEPTGGPGGGMLLNCHLPRQAGLRCPDDLECFDARVRGRSATISPTVCTGRHTWEAFVVGDLPTGLDPTDDVAVRAAPVVQTACSENMFRIVTLWMDTRGWEFEVLPPDPAMLATGDRTFRCLAGRGPGALTGPTLADR
ncbi:protein kinase domain-containing protein [Solwaraspora sp. WMMB335]|uniref:serine/threonine-protein kinase n=1 Tax=Solwaraspora sp. WMMB335 TaxID=3404118 RepID=UPI003B956335